MIAAAIAACVVGCACAYVALRLGTAFLAWATAHEEGRRSDALAKRVEAVEATQRTHDAAIDKLKAENRAVSMSGMGRGPR